MFGIGKGRWGGLGRLIKRQAGEGVGDLGRRHVEGGAAFTRNSTSEMEMIDIPWADTPLWAGGPHLGGRVWPPDHSLSVVGLKVRLDIVFLISLFSLFQNPN